MKIKKAGARKQPAWKLIADMIARILPRRKPCRCAPDLWQVVADLCILLRQHESAQTELLVGIHEAAERLETIEAALWAMRAETKQ
jgi:hypothetical protein